MNTFWLSRRFVVSAAVAVALIGWAATAVAKPSGRPGDRDLTFSGDGKVVTQFNYARGDMEGRAVVAYPNGGIVAVGSSYSSRILVAKYKPNGDRDFRFGIHGRLVIDSRQDGYGVDARDVALDSRGRILIGATSFRRYRDSYFSAIRLHRGGGLDRSFGDRGWARVSAGGRLNSIALAHKGKIILAGGTANQYDYRGKIAIARLDSDGSLDRGFSGNGSKVIGLRKNSEAVDVTVDSEDRPLIAGFAESSQTHDGHNSAVIRLDRSGNMDRSFDRDGKKLVDLGMFDSLSGIGLLPSGKIVVAGRDVQTKKGGLITEENVFIARMNSRGKLDRSFDRDGVDRLDIEKFESPPELELQRDGKVLVGFGSGHYAGYPDAWLVARIRRNGGLDRSFQGNGVAYANYGGTVAGLALQRDGRILETGWGFEDDASQDGYGIVVARYCNDGLPQR